MFLLKNSYDVSSEIGIIHTKNATSKSRIAPPRVIALNMNRTKVFAQNHFCMAGVAASREPYVSCIINNISIQSLIFQNLENHVSNTMPAVLI